MKFKINGVPWTLVFEKDGWVYPDYEHTLPCVEGDDPDSDTACYGLCDKDLQKITMISGGVTEYMAKAVFAHELMHAMLGTYQNRIVDEEALCDFYGAHADEFESIRHQFNKEIEKRGLYGSKRK